MKLEKEDKDALIALKKHPGWNVILRIREDFRAKLATQLLSQIDLNKQEHIDVLRTNQVYMKAVDDFIASVNSSGGEVFVPKGI